MEWHLLGILAFVVIYNIYRYYHEDNNYEYCPVDTSTSDNNQVIETNMEETISTRQLALTTIEHIGSGVGIIAHPNAWNRVPVACGVFAVLWLSWASL